MDIATMEETNKNSTMAFYLANATNIEQLLVQNLGPRQKDFVSAVLLTIVYSIIFVSGMVGNICTCLVIARNHSMQTTTNYYLFSLAVSDVLLIFFGLPPELYAIWEAYPWRLGEVFCYLRQSMLESTSYASVLTITAFTVERYLAICHPLLAHKISALSRAVKIIISIWIISLLVALPYSIHTRIYNAVVIAEVNIPVPDSLICSIPSSYLNGFMYYMFQVSTFLFFVGPVTIITILYILIGVALRRSPLCGGSSKEKSYAGMKNSPSSPRRQQQQHHHRQHHQHQQPRRVVIRMLVAVTVAFITCWAPFHAQRLMVLYVVQWTPQLHLIQSHIFYISGVLYFVSSTVNPILYNVISKRYRGAFRQTIFPCCYSRQNNGSNSTARQSERFSRSQAMVVLKNGNESMRVVFRHEMKDPILRDCEMTPLNGTRRSTIMEDDDITSIDRGAVSSSSSSESLKVFVRSSIKRHTHSLEVPQKDSNRKRSCLKQTAFYLDVTRNSGNKEDSSYLVQNRRAAEALKKAEKPRRSYAHQVNGRVSMTTLSAPCRYESTNKSIVR